MISAEMGGTREQFSRNRKGGTVEDMASGYYPLEEAKEDVRVRTSVRLSKKVQDDVELVAAIWNEFDRILGMKKTTKWKASSVIEQIIERGLERIWDEDFGGRPRDGENIQKFAQRALEHLKKKKAT